MLDELRAIEHDARTEGEADIWRDEGRAASDDACPYPAWSRAGQCWLAGWQAAREEQHDD